MFTWLKNHLGHKPRKYLIFRFSGPIDPLREALILDETETTYFIRIPIYVFSGWIHDWEQRIPKNHPRIVEVFTR